jgi:POT family proton-dependent oligopeptide transporter
LGTKILGHVGNLDVQEANTVDESSYGLLLRISNLKQLSLTIILSVLSIIGWYSLGWLLIVIFFLTVIAALMMMIYKELTSQVDKDRFVVLLLSFIMVIIFGCLRASRRIDESVYRY